MSNCNDKDKASRNYDNADAKLESKSYFIKQPTYNQDSETEVGSHSHTEVYDGHPIPESAPTSPSEFVGVQQLQNSSIPIVDNKKGLQWTGIADDDLVDDGIPAPGCNVDSEIDAGVSASRPSHQPPHDTQVDSNTYDEDAPHVSDMRTELQLPDIANRTPSLATADVVTAPQHSSVKSSSSSDTSQLRQLDSALNRTPDGTSIAESGALHLEENGRTYHRYKEGAYWLPNDPAEQDRLDFQHAVFRLILRNKLAFAPVTAPKNVMDVATGTGVWAIEFAEENPTSHVVGTDLSAIQPREYEAANCRFEVDDAEEEWLNYPMFDYVHVRLVCTCFNDHRVVMKNIFDNLNSGGWVEYQDYDMEFLQANPDYEGTAVVRWSQALIRGLANKGRDLLVPRRYKSMMIEAGFVDVQEEKIPLPVGPWTQDPYMQKVGLYMLRNVQDGLRFVGLGGPSWIALRAAGMSPEDIDALILEIRDELKKIRNNMYCWVYVVWGRKP